jgi:uncharacterized protein
MADDAERWQRWMDNFSRTFLERDIPGLGSKVSPQALGRFWHMLAHFHGQTWNAAELARSMDVSATAVITTAISSREPSCCASCRRGMRI